MEPRFIEPPVITVKQDTCSDCGLCVKICPTRNFRSSNDALRKVATVHHPNGLATCWNGLLLGASNNLPLKLSNII